MGSEVRAGVMDSQQPPSLMSQHAGKPVPSVPALDRMRAMCSLLGEHACHHSLRVDI